MQGILNRIVNQVVLRSIRKKLTRSGGESYRMTKIYTSSDLNYYKSASEIATEVINDQTGVPNEFHVM